MRTYPPFLSLIYCSEQKMALIPCKFIKPIATEDDGDRQLLYIYNTDDRNLSLNITQGKNNAVLSSHLFPDLDTYDRFFRFLLSGVFSHDPPLRIKLYNTQHSRSKPPRRRRPKMAPGAKPRPFESALDSDGDDTGYESSDDDDEATPPFEVDANPSNANGILLDFSSGAKNNISSLDRNYLIDHLSTFQLSHAQVEDAIALNEDIVHLFKTYADKTSNCECIDLTFFSLPCREKITAM